MNARFPLQFLRLYLFITILLFGGGLKNAVQAQEINPAYQSVIRKYLGTTDTSRFMRITHEFLIQRHVVIPKPVVVEKTTLEVAGTVKGDILALDGDVYLDSTASVQGDIIAINGWVTLKPGAEVSGIIRETTWETVASEDREDDEYIYIPKPYPRDVSREIGQKFILRYNRAEGVFVGIRRPRHYAPERLFNLYYELGYGFASKSWRYLVGLERNIRLGEATLWDLGLKKYDRTVVRDTWRLGETENSLTAFFFNEDYYDYYRADGFAVTMGFRYKDQFVVEGEYAEERTNSMPNRTDWAVWGKTKQFRPAMELGEDARYYRLFRVNGKFQAGTRSWNGERNPLAQFNVWGEYAPRSWMAQWQYQRLETEVKLTVPLSHIDRFRVRLRGGSSFGKLPVQRQFFLGGFSTLRGYRFNAFQGNRYLLANVEYQISSAFIEDFIFGLDTDFVIFYDAGSAWWVDEQTPVWELLPGEATMYQDVGIGIGSVTDGIRVNIARPLGSSAGPVRINVRIQKAF